MSDFNTNNNYPQKNPEGQQQSPQYGSYQQNSEGSWRVEGGYTNSNYTNPQYTNPTPNPAPKKPKKSSGKFRTTALLVALCMVLSAACGFGGAMAAHLAVKDDTATVSDFAVSSEDNSSSASDSANSDTTTASHASVSGTALSTTDVVKKCADSVVEIVTETVSRDSMFGQYVTSGAGSGVILSADGYIVTNHHVIDGATNIKVTLRNGTQYDATLIASDAQSDLAVIKIDGENLTTAVFADSDSLQVGQTAIAIGNPLGSLGGSVSEGILSALDREITIDDNVMTLLQTDAAINPGNSGGGLFNDKGELIGIVNAKSTGAEIDGLGFAIPANLVQSVAEQLINQGYVSGRISTGMSLIDIEDRYTAYYYGVSRTGVYVQNVTGSNAQDAGFQSGDCIVAVGDTAVSSVSEFNAAIKQYAVGDTVKVTVIRGKRQGTLSLTLNEYTGEANQ